MNKDSKREKDPRQEEQEIKKENTTLNLDTGKEEPLPDPDDEPTMDFAPGSDGGSAADGGAS